MFGDVEVGAGEQNPEVGDVGLRRPHLLAGDHPFVAVANRTGGEPREIGSGARLGVELTPDLLAAERRWDEPMLEGVGGVIDEGRHHHPEAESEQGVLAGNELEALVAKRDVVLDRESRTAELRRVRDTGKAGVGQRTAVRLASGGGAPDRCEGLRKQREERADTGAELRDRLGRLGRVLSGHGCLRVRPALDGDTTPDEFIRADRTALAAYASCMSIPVAIDDLAPAIEQYRWAYLLTVRDDLRAHIVAVTPAWDGDALVMEVGKGTGRNASERPAVSLCYPPTEPEGYSLIIDGDASVEGQSVGAVRSDRGGAAPAGAGRLHRFGDRLRERLRAGRSDGGLRDRPATRARRQVAVRPARC